MQLSIRVSDEINDRLTLLSQKTGRSKTFYMKEAILEYLEDLEDYYLAEYRINNPEKTYKLDDLEKKIDMEN